MKKNKKNIITNSGKRYLAFILIVILLFSVLLGRIAYLQFVKGTFLKTLATKQQTTSRLINAKRGTIYDSTGTALAISADVDTITINPNKITGKTDDETKKLKEKVAQKFSDLFELDYNETLEKVSSTNTIETIAQKVDKNKVTELQEWMSSNKITSGINIDKDTKRYYPYNNLSANLIGFCGSDEQGLTGLEYYWDSTLAGTPGKITTTQDASQDIISNNDAQYYAPQNGNDITLTIDRNVQTIAEKYLEQACNSNSCKDGGNVIIMNPTNGEILAMATYPNFNLNEPFTPNSTISSSWNSMSSSAQSDALQKMWKNTAVSNTYEPGSVFKVIVASTALEENIVQADAGGQFYCSGVQKVADREIHCANVAGHGSQSLRQALMNSCNPAFIQLGQKIGTATLYKYFKSFGLFNKTGIQTTGEAVGIFHSENDVSSVDLATTSFGQRFTITPIQMITAVSAIANHGVLVQPKIVKEITNTDTGTTTTVETKEIRQVISEETANTMLSMMKSVVTDGGGQYGQVKGYSIAGKTGTSESTQGTSGYVASFLAVAPAENPQVVALLTLYNPQGKDHFGGHIAAPVVSQILSEVLPYLEVPNSETTSDQKNTATITLRNVTGKTISEAKTILQEQGLQCSISGNDNDIITEQTPKQGTKLEKGAIVKLYTESTINNKKKVTVPDLKGLSYEKAKSALQSVGLNIKQIGTGISISQDPISGSELYEGTVVAVTFKEEIGSSSH